MLELPELEATKARRGIRLFSRVASLLAMAVVALSTSCQCPRGREYDGPLYAVGVADRFLWREHGRCGFIDSTGRVVIPLRFDYVEQFSEGLALAYRGRRQGYINRRGRFVIVADGWSPVGDFRYGLAAFAKHGGGMGYIDTTGRVIIEPRFGYSGPFSEGFAEVTARRHPWFDTGLRMYSRLSGCINRAGVVVIEPQFAELDTFSEGLACASVDGEKFGYIDTRGRVVVEPVFDRGTAFSYGRAVVTIGDSSFAIDRTGRPVFARRFSRLDEYHEGLARAKDGELCGYVDTLGKWVIPPHFARAAPFNEGLAYVEYDSVAGFIDRAGELVVTLPDGWSGWGFRQGRAWIHQWRGTAAGYVDRTGRFVWMTRRAFK